MKFQSNYASRERKAVDLSNSLIKQYVEIAPYTKDSETGDYLNETPYPVLKEIEPKDIQKEIDSFADECDIYNIIRRSRQGLDVSAHFKDKVYGDISNIPQNELEQLAQAKAVSAVNIPDDVKTALLNNVSDEELLALLKKRVETPSTPESKDSEVK